jgi:hypothetical protein
MQKRRKIQMEGAEQKEKKLLVREYDIKRDNDFFLGGGRFHLLRYRLTENILRNDSYESNSVLGERRYMATIKN